MSKVIVSFSLDSDRDHRLVHWLNSQENRSAAIREALEAHLGRGVTLSDVYLAIRELERKIESGSLPVSAPDPARKDEPPDVAASLDALGL